MTMNLLRQLVQFITVLSQSGSGVFEKPSVRNPIAVSLGAIAGALARYYISLGFARTIGTEFPYATLSVNLLGSFLMGLFTTLFFERAPLISPELFLLIAVGFLGSFTTFSSYEMDSMNLLNHYGFGKALAYWIGSIVLGGLCLYCGIVCARLIR